MRPYLIDVAKRYFPELWTPGRPDVYCQLQHEEVAGEIAAMSDEPGLVDPKEFEAQGELVRKASERRNRADEALKKAETEANAAHLAWMKAWSTFNRFAQEAAGLRYKAHPDADKRRYPGPPSTWKETSNQ